MLRKESLIKLSHELFTILVLLIPFNLGKHFIIRDAYVWGVLVDYLVPTIYIQDILIILILFVWVVGGGVSKARLLSLFSRVDFQVATVFVFSCLFSVLSAQRFLPALYFWIRLLIYFLLFIFILCEISIKKHFFKFLSILSISITFISLLGIIQFVKQGSLFNNYYFFGEQPYSFSTYGIAKESFFGRLVVPSYATFRHPNVLGGFLSVFLLWLVPYLKGNKKYIFAFSVGVLALMCSFSVSAWVAFAIGIIVYFLLLTIPNTNYLRKIKILGFTVAFCLTMLTLPGLSLLNNSPNPSFFRRSDLLISSYKMAATYPLFGVGINNFTVLIDNFAPRSTDLRFTQPVHNVFALVFSETGLFSYTLFIVLVFMAVRRQLDNGLFNVLFISLIQLLVLFSADHYFITANQTFLAMWVILGMSFSIPD
jgi:hypothetical protein